MISKELKKKKDDEASQPWAVIRPSANQCKKCVHAYEDTQYTIGAEKANCYMFEPPEDKPHEVLWENKDCPYFEEKEET